MGNTKILHLITTIDHGGAEHHLLDLCRGLREYGYEIVVGYWKGKGELQKDFESIGVKVVRLPFYHPLDPLNFWRIFRLIQREMPDILHTHMPLLEFYGNFAGKLANAPLIITSKHNDYNYFKSNLFMKKLHLLMSMPTKGIIAISDHVRSFTLRNGVASHVKVKTIYYGLDISKFDNKLQSKDYSIVRRELISGCHFLIGTVARLEPQKGLQFFLKAIPLVLKEFPDVQFVIVGEGSQKAALLALVKQLGIEENVRFVGRRFDIPQVMKAFDVFVLPSLWEGFGLVLLEAMAAEVPIVATRVSAIPEVVSEGETGFLVPKEDAVQLAEKIIHLLRDENIRRKMGELGRQRVKQYFDVQRMVRETIDFYQELLER